MLLNYKAWLGSKCNIEYIIANIILKFMQIQMLFSFVVCGYSNVDAISLNDRIFSSGFLATELVPDSSEPELELLAFIQTVTCSFSIADKASSYRQSLQECFLFLLLHFYMSLMTLTHLTC